MRKFLIILMLFIAGCKPGLHRGHVFVHDANHVEVVFEREMTMKYEKDGVKVEASSMKSGFFEDIIKFLLLRPRN